MPADPATLRNMVNNAADIPLHALRRSFDRRSTLLGTNNKDSGAACSIESTSDARSRYREKGCANRAGRCP